MIIITEPFVNFPDVDGTAVDGGFIYLGTAGLNPETSPISVYWDAALTIPAAQPIRTLNGFASRAGSPGKLHVGAGDYSITVRNKNATLIYSALQNSQPLEKYQFLAASIQNTGSGWAFVQDADHEKIGFIGISVNGSGEIELAHDANVTVSSVLAQSDNSNIRISARDETTKTTLKLSAALNFEVDTATGTINADAHWGNNITGAVSTNYCTIAHPESNIKPIIQDTGDGVDRTKVIVNSHTATTIKLAGMGDLCGYVSRETGSWVYTGKMKNIPTLQWIPHHLNILHETIDNNTLQISSPYLAHRAVLHNTPLIKEQTNVVFLDNGDGTLEMVETTFMRFHFNRFQQVEYNFIKGQVVINRGYAQINANNLVHATHKIWVFGVMEIA